ncbi:MAG: CAP domain-containing protein [Proteobacteria bacterium]|nr:MAG: CAP domain-containing protein [Pseudomonadota bacterium]
MKSILLVMGLSLLGTTACRSDKNDNNKEEDEGQSYAGDNASGIDSGSTPALTTCYKGDVWTCAVEAAIVKETNLLRSKALTQSFEDSYVARAWSISQAEVGRISHDGFPEDRTELLKTTFQAEWGVFAENVAMAQTLDTDPAKVGKQFVQMWNGSAGHKANMLGNYTYIGAGVTRVGNSIYATQIFH